jgi:hypothetical protein
VLRKPPLTVPQILKWADAHKAKTGTWPSSRSGAVLSAPGETWGGIDQALRNGHRGLSGGCTLAELLAEHRGKRHPGKLPRLTEASILAWADAHHARTGRWPTIGCGPILEASGETWATVDAALHNGSRGLPGGDSLRQLLIRCGRVHPRGRQSIRFPGKGRPRNEVRRRLVARLREQGLRLAEIAVRLKVTRQAISAMLQRIGDARGGE